MKAFYTIGLLSSVVFLSSCSNDDEIAQKTETQATSKKAVIENYANIAYSSYSDAYNDALLLKTSINSFTKNPNETTFLAAKTAWLTARESYGTTEAFRLSDGPIDDEDGPEDFINAWPLDENYIDYVEGAENSGIINNPTVYPTIDKAALMDLNLKGEKNITVGFHAIEFLLWGQDLTNPSDKKAGQRKYTDYVDGGTAANQNRRRMYLNVCADLLPDHLLSVANEWKINGNYRTTFTSLNENEAIRRIFTGISALSKSELAGERIYVAYDNKDQEDEHSCFSDNTHRDIRLNLQGIINVYKGQYKTIKGASIENLITENSIEFSSGLNTKVELAFNSVNATAIPFDYAISNDTERPKVIASVTALRSLGDAFVEAASKIGIKVSAELPE